MIDQKYLLTDDQMRRFISHGYVELKTDFPAEFHATLSDKIEAVMEKEGNPGNNILPRITETRAVFENPVIRGALTRGHDFLLSPGSEPGNGAIGYHARYAILCETSR